MPKKVRVFPYKQGSRSAKELANMLEGRVLKLQGSRYVPRAGDVVINWGAGQCPQFGPARVLNADGVGAAANKLRAFKAMAEAGVRIPPTATTRQGAEGLEFPVVCRTKLTGHSGEGIVMAANADELVPAPLYTQYVKKKDEYRVHVFNGEVFFVQRKARKLDVENPNWQIRNLAGGFVFVEEGPELAPRDVLDQSVAAIKALNLDFGGVDVIWNEVKGKAYVLEINTACGLEERTARHYADQVLRLL